jgi:Na+/H+ antiporter NhaC
LRLLNLTYIAPLYRYFLFALAGTLCLLSPDLKADESTKLKVNAPEHLVGKDSLTGTLKTVGKSLKGEKTVHFTIGKDTFNSVLTFKNGKAPFKIPFKSASKLRVKLPAEGLKATHEVRSWPGWVSIIPPLLAILLALLLREVITSLFIGVITGLLFIKGFTPSGLLNALFRFVDTYLIDVLSQSSHLSIILFSLLIGGMVSLISANGGMLGFVAYLKGWASNARRTQFVTWLTGVAIFFDDYANTLIVGNTMRPLGDRYQISREKLAYLVDSTAAPIASVAFITTWIGAQLDYIESASRNLPIQESAYAIFFQSLNYAFYPVFALAFILLLIFFNRDFGPMYKAEANARVGNSSPSPTETEDKQDTKEGNALDALGPLATLVLTAFGALLYTGYEPEVWSQTGTTFLVKIAETIGQANAYNALLWASTVSLLLAILLSVLRGRLSLSDTIEQITDGFKSMLGALMILVLAWSLAAVTGNLNTAGFLAQLFTGNIPPVLFPALVFILAAVVSFSTGSSWGTMAILYPLVLPATYQASAAAGLDQAAIMPLFYHVVSVVLAGSVMGDHCSPLSDTTILSSLATKCNHIQHVRTQLPYALVVGVVSLVMGHLLTALGWLPSFIAFTLGIALMAFIIRYIAGKKLPGAKVVAD